VVHLKNVRAFLTCWLSAGTINISWNSCKCVSTRSECFSDGIGATITYEKTLLRLKWTKCGSRLRLSLSSCPSSPRAPPCRSASPCDRLNEHRSDFGNKTDALTTIAFIVEETSIVVPDRSSAVQRNPCLAFPSTVGWESYRFYQNASVVPLSSLQLLRFPQSTRVSTKTFLRAEVLQLCSYLDSNRIS